MIRKKRLSIALLICAGLVLTACQRENPYNKYEVSFMDVFDTFVIMVGYTETEAEFSGYGQIVYDRLKVLHKEYDIYNTYDGLNNLKTINDNAGVAPVKVSAEILDLVEYGIDAYGWTDGAVNIAMGAVLRIWHDHRVEGIDDPDMATLPDMDKLREAQKLTSIADIVVDRENMTVFLKEKGMSLDVGAVAKGYAARLATEEAKAAGMTSALVNVGGNICSVGAPLDGVRARWGVGIQDPDLTVSGVQNTIDTVYTNNEVVVTSGNYQRYYVVDGVAYNHIIDQNTLMPADLYTSVSVVCGDSALADVLSTAVFTLPVEDGERLLEKFNAHALWIHHDRSMYATEGYVAISKVLGGYSSVDN